MVNQEVQAAGQELTSQQSELQYLLATTDVEDILDDRAEYGVSATQLVETLTPIGDYREIIACASHLTPTQKSDLLIELVHGMGQDKQKHDEIMWNIDQFISAENQTTITQLLITYAPDIALEQLKYFPDIDRSQLATALIATDKGAIAVAKNIIKFPQLNCEPLIQKLMLSRKGTEILVAKFRNFPAIDNINKYEFLKKLIDIDLISARELSGLVANLVDSTNSTQCAQLLSDANLAYIVVENIHLFPSVNADELYQQLKQNRNFSTILENAKLFHNIDWKDLEENLIHDDNIFSPQLILQYLEYFPNINLISLIKPLVASRSVFLIDMNIARFAQENIEALTEELFAVGAAHIIGKHLDIFQTVDLNRLWQSLIKEHESQLILHNIEKFPMVDRSELTEALIDDNQAHQIFYNIGVFANVDREKLGETLIKRNKLEVLLKNIDSLPVDIWQVLSLLINNKKEILGKYLNVFIQRDQLITVAILVENGATRFVADNIDRFPDLDINLFLDSVIQVDEFEIAMLLTHKFRSIQYADVMKRIVQHFKERQETTLPNDNMYMALVKFYAWKNMIPQELFEEYFKIIDGYPASNIHPEFIAEELPITISKLEALDETGALKYIHICKNEQLYKSLRVIIATKKYSAKQVGLSWLVLEKKLKLLVDHRNFENANDLLDCAQLLFADQQSTIDNWRRIIAQKPDKLNVPERTKFTELHVLKETFKYYLHILLIKSNPLNRLSPELTAPIHQHINELFKIIKEYMVVAVLSEMRNDNISSYASWDLNPTIYLTYTNEQMRIFFDVTAKKFNDKKVFSRGEGLGGKQWAIIARLGSLMWEEQTQMDAGKQIALINVAINIQHNTNFLFNKDQGRVHIVEADLKEFLDFEAAGNHNLSAFIEYGLEKQIITAKEAESYLRLYRQLKLNTIAASNIGLFDSDEIYQKIESQEVRRALTAIDKHPIPNEIKAYLKSIYDPITGFTQHTTGYEYLGRLLKATDIKWTTNDENIKYYKQNEHEIYYFDIEGYCLAFWYTNGELRNIKDVKNLHEIKGEIASVTQTTIVKAMLGTVREGD